LILDKYQVSRRFFKTTLTVLSAAGMWGMPIGQRQSMYNSRRFSSTL